ncbi:hypothetical protein [Natronocalculus amylovorans]|uniref:Uncharacterized protein n=1 Tax=Natronocalculus amylovorans TaxID=2917812 RepID=A0AAE3K9S0_9EURY|nr:hypothetical protein [Natronocalculus amylovorans]MCL9818366.1 hypothetical protein [Natronocalculus amylovorans]
MSAQEPERSTMYVADIPFGADSEIEDVRQIREALENSGYEVTMAYDNSHFIVTREAANAGDSDQ